MGIWLERGMTKRGKQETKIDAFMIMYCACNGCTAHFKSACQPPDGGGIRPAGKLSVPNQTALSQSFVWLPVVLCVQIIGIIIRINSEPFFVYGPSRSKNTHASICWASPPKASLPCDEGFGKPRINQSWSRR